MLLLSLQTSAETVVAGSYEGHIMSYNSIVAAQPNGVTQQQETGAMTPHARPMSRLAVVGYLLLDCCLAE